MYYTGFVNNIYSSYMWVKVYIIFLLWAISLYTFIDWSWSFPCSGNYVYIYNIVIGFWCFSCFHRTGFIYSYMRFMLYKQKRFLQEILCIVG